MGQYKDHLSFTSLWSPLVSPFAPWQRRPYCMAALLKIISYAPDRNNFDLKLHSVPWRDVSGLIRFLANESQNRSTGLHWSLDLFRQNPVFTSLHLKSSVHVVPPQGYSLCPKESSVSWNNWIIGGLMSQSRPIESNPHTCTVYTKLLILEL